MNKETIKRILIAVAIAVGLLVVLKLISSRGSVSLSGLMGSTGPMEHMSDLNQNNQHTGTGVVANSGTNDSETIERMSNNSGSQGLGSASSSPGVQSIRSQGCFPKEQLTPNELLPQDNSTAWAQVNPQGAGTLKDKNFLQAAHHIGINTVGQTQRNANLQLRSEPPNPQVKVSPWLQSTIDPDVNRKPLEIGGCA